uniref:Uncharacterized protein n=1 Tax=Arundo donax TaxID=35708 RepID=A0A0A9GGI0_ARUDO
MEAEIQCIILTRAHQTWATLAEDQMALYKAQKSLSEGYKQLGLKLRHTENRAMILEEMPDRQRGSRSSAKICPGVQKSCNCCVLL